MFASTPNPIVLHADQEHSGIRMAIFLSLFAALLIAFLLARWLLLLFAPPAIQDYTIFLACVGAVPLALLSIWVLEKGLKRVWHSGLSLVLDGRGLAVHDRRDGAVVDPTAPPAFLWAANMGQLNWYFRLSGYPRGGRERRAPAKWLCLATELQQDDVRLSIFTFMSPAAAKPWTDDPRQGYHIINPTELYDRSARSRIGPPTRPNIPHRLLQTKDARYWLAERRRWEFGIELTPDDFATLLRSVAAGRAGIVSYSP
ncbi:protein of unknown function [Candidatus Promineifilum breve]|uniref:Uncharacterized protein n=1 Tax=Candidatus Promineifilum breve TaxID=1806508 RepID=A0A160T919_9CHLR|nr:hypothetical protein [Candidatus Promineifilum breve]CUS05938.1 protein of unknown function [Candidatus Promineifilum breve]